MFEKSFRHLIAFLLALPLLGWCVFPAFAEEPQGVPALKVVYFTPSGISLMEIGNHFYGRSFRGESWDALLCVPCG